MAQVLVVEDDEQVCSALTRQLSQRGHAVRSANRAMDGLKDVTQNATDVVVLDLGLPDLDGSDVLQMLRGVSDVPVIVATARDGEGEVVRLLRAGADDYLTKPFSAELLSARLEAVLRRVGTDRTSENSRVLAIGGLVIDMDRREVTLDEESITLTRREFDMLAFLASRPGRVISRKELLATVWRQPYGDDQTIDVHLSWLRRKLGESAAHPRFLHTVRGVGVKFERV